MITYFPKLKGHRTLNTAHVRMGVKLVAVLVWLP